MPSGKTRVPRSRSALSPSWRPLGDQAPHPEDQAALGSCFLSSWRQTLAPTVFSVTSASAE